MEILLEGELFGTFPYVHAEKSIMNLVKLNQISIVINRKSVITILFFIINQMEFHLIHNQKDIVSTIIFLYN